MSHAWKLTTISAIVAAVVLDTVISAGVRQHDAEKRMLCGVSALWQCPVQAVTMRSLGTATYQFIGCGHDSTYHCKWAGEACLLQGSQSEVLEPRSCDS